MSTAAQDSSRRSGAPLAVLGGGISGLTAAFHLMKAGRNVLLLEASDRFGGVIQTHMEDGWGFEFGPNTVLASDPSAERLITTAGLEDIRLTARAESGIRYVLKRGELIPMPMSPPAFLTTRLFSPGAKLRVLWEPFVPRFAGQDESIAQFARRRLGPELLDYAVGPFVSGVYAGDPEKLSVRYAVRKIHALEVKYGSLIRGAIAMRRPGEVSAAPGPRGGLLSFRGGLAELPARLGAALGERARLKTTVESVRRVDGGFEIAVRDPGGEMASIIAPEVVVALDSLGAARILAALDPDGALGVPRLNEIPYAGVTVTGLGFRRQDVGHPLDGFGFLVPRVEKRRLLGCLFISTLFPGRAPEGHVALTAILGGATDPEAATLPEEKILTIILDELRPLLDITGPPVYVKTVLWPRAIPQFNLGHDRYLSVATGLEQRFPGLHILGNWRNGVSVGDCITFGTALADRLTGVQAPGGGGSGAR